MAIDAVPDITNIQVQVFAQAGGLSAEQAERSITFPIEKSMGGISGVTQVRSLSRFGLSVVTVIFRDGTDSLGVGVVTSLFLVLVLSWISLFYSKRLPLSKLFTMSSMMMLGLSTILAGKAIHAFQEAGWVGVTVFPIHFRVDLFGIYPTIETMVIQLATFLLALSLWLYGKRPSVAAARST